MAAKSIMIQGTASHVGKSVLTAALCRIFREDGINAAPFKSQNMALNSFVTEDGKEMGRAQVVQAEAAGITPHSDMNPILLKPQSDKKSQVIIHGKVYGNMSAVEYHRFKKEAKRFVEESYGRLVAGHDLIVIEGAGSPAEINLRENDLANMGTAHMANAPVLLVGDIDRGGVFAAIVGTLELLDPIDKKRIKGIIINKFRGDIELLKPGIEALEERTMLPVLGVVPYFRDIHIQEEDGADLHGSAETKNTGAGILKISVILLPHISNFTDFDPFTAEKDVLLRYVKRGEKIGKTDVVIIPGTKNTLADLNYIREAGYDVEIEGHILNGGRVIGICGGYQMLGRRIADPHGVESGPPQAEAKALGWLPIETVMDRDKVAHQIEAIPLNGQLLSGGSLSLNGYEIHMGNTSYSGGARPLFLITRRSAVEVAFKDGAMSEDGKVWGTYIHGIFDNDDFRRALIDVVKREKGRRPSSLLRNARGSDYARVKEEGYIRLAEVVRANIDMKMIYDTIGLKPAAGRGDPCTHII